MSKQGIMIFKIHTYTLPKKQIKDLISKYKETVSSLSELNENYDIIFTSVSNSPSAGGIDIQVFPYKNYRFDVSNMTIGEIENYIEGEVKSKLYKP